MELQWMLWLAVVLTSLLVLGLSGLCIYVYWTLRKQSLKQYQRSVRK